jgi:hypothetical protein
MLPVLKSTVHRFLGAFGYRLVPIPRQPGPITGRRHRLLKHDDEVVEKAKVHLAGTAPVPQGLPSLGERWGSYAQKLRDRIDIIRSAEELVSIGQSPASGIETSLPPQELTGYCDSFYLRMLETTMPDHLIGAFQSFHSPPMTTYKTTYQDRNIDFVTLVAGVELLTIFHWLDGNYPKSVCDIGGGTGKYAHAWLTNSVHRPDLIVILDIPETLVFSETLLRTVFGDAVQYITDASVVPNEKGIVLCPVANAAVLRKLSFDLVMNTGSMQEMTDTWIDWYMDWLDQQPCKYFYSDNFFANALANIREGHNSWSPRPSARWQMIRSAFYSGVRNIAVMMFEKDGASQTRQQPSRGGYGWLQRLDIARSNGDEVSYRQALQLPIPCPTCGKRRGKLLKL